MSLPQRRSSLTFVPAVLALVAFSRPAAGVGSEGRPAGPLADLYQRAVEAVLGIECVEETEGGDLHYFGTGVIIDPAGLVLTSITVVPEKSRDIRVYLRGGKTLPADFLSAVPDKEFSLIRIRDGRNLPFLALGDSSSVRVGHLSLTLGNAFRSIENDDQVALAVGMVSGRYTLNGTRSQARYVGPVLETTAAVNDGMDGGPLLNERGEVIGLLSLNFSTQRWLGTAVPINALKPLFGKFRPWYSDREQPGKNYIGLEVSSRFEDGEEGIIIDRVYEGGPARAAGLERGMRLLSIDAGKLHSVDEFRDRFEKALPGARLRLGVLDAKRSEAEISTDPAEGITGKTREITVPVWRRF
jgi:serine protease Do